MANEFLSSEEIAKALIETLDRACDSDLELMAMVANEFIRRIGGFPPDPNA